MNWSHAQVLQWIEWAINEFSLEGVMMGKFAMTGHDLLVLGREAFLDRAPPFMGDILWEHLEILQKGTETTDITRCYRLETGNKIEQYFVKLQNIK